MAQKGASGTASAAKKARAALKFFDGTSHGGAYSGHIDRYNGIRINNDIIQPDTTQDDFRSKLLHTISVYREQGFRGVWLKLRKD